MASRLHFSGQRKSESQRKLLKKTNFRVEGHLFDGETFEPALDETRLLGQLGQVRKMVSDGEWHTLRELAAGARGSEAGISARLRDLRKERFGNYTIERRRVDPSSGCFEYRMVLTAEKSGEAAKSH